MNGPQQEVAAQDLRGSVTIIVTARERFSVAIRSLRAIADMTEGPYQLVYVDANSPQPVARELKSICEQHGFCYVRKDYFMTPNQARNFGAKCSSTPYMVFMDNDVVPSRGWLSALQACADETGAAVVAPLTCQKEPLHEEVHQAGGEFTEDLEAFLSTSPTDIRITDVHLLQGQKVRDVQLERGPTQCCEFHCALVRRDAFLASGGLDEGLLATKEHLDFCMTIWRAGGQVIFEPKAVVTYLFPSRSSPLTMADWPYFTLRWSPAWLQRSLDHFQAKWGLAEDPYFDDRRGRVTWRHEVGIAKPLVNRMPLVRRSHRASMLAQRAVTGALKLWSDAMAKTQERTSRG